MTGAAVPRRPEDILWYDGPAAFLRTAELAKRTGTAEPAKRTGTAELAMSACAKSNAAKRTGTAEPAKRTGTADVSTGARAAWLRGVALGAAGRYAEAAEVLAPLNTSLALSTLASHARQVGRHAPAAGLDRRALDLADTDEARADASSGLVADALGQGDARTATRLLAAAREVANGWRATTRLRWVAAELALLRARPEEAVTEAEEALRTARAAAAPRHVTKSLLVRGVARKVAGDATGAQTDLLDALIRAEDQGLPTLAWPAAAVLAQLDPVFGDRARPALASVVAGLGAQGPDFATRADVAVLLGDPDRIG